MEQVYSFPFGPTLFVEMQKFGDGLFEIMSQYSPRRIEKPFSLSIMPPVNLASYFHDDFNVDISIVFRQSLRCSEYAVILRVCRYLAPGQLDSEQLYLGGTVQTSQYIGVNRWAYRNIRVKEFVSVYPFFHERRSRGGRRP